MHGPLNVKLSVAFTQVHVILRLKVSHPRCVV